MSKTPENNKDRVAIYSPKNIFWQGVGKITKGYNIVTQEKAELWVATMKDIRIATPEEVAKEYGL